jgi:hypothetical protein
MYLLNSIRDFRVKWFDAVRSLSTYPEIAPWEVNSLLYRTWQHAMLYHLHGMEQIKAKLTKT